MYLEKPCSHNPYEGELLTEAVHKHKRVLQMGAQRRSSPNTRQAIAEIRGGIIGKAYFGRAWYVNNRASIGRGKPAPVPPYLDYELWQGPAPRHPYRDNLIHYNWHWFWHWGTGEALNNGTHEVDIARWALGVDWPARVTSSGGRYHYADDWETPDTQVIGLDFPGGKTISWKGRSCNDYRELSAAHDLYQSAVRLFAQRPADGHFPEPLDHKVYRVQLWDTEGLPFTIDNPEPVRVVRSEEVLERQRYRHGERTEHSTDHEWLWVTRLPQQAFPAAVIRQLRHSR